MGNVSVLIVEDDDDLRDLLEDGLGELGYDCLGVNSAEDAIQVLSFFEPRIAVVDIFMRGQGGITAMQIIGQQQPDCQIIAVSGGFGEMSSEQSLQAATQMGAQRVLAKPFTVDQLSAVIGELSAAGPTDRPVA